MKRMGYFDGLKGIAAMIVFLSHYKVMGLAQGITMLDWLFGNTIVSGNLFVCVFIILSTFFMCHAMNRGGKQIVVKRYFRLAVPIGFVLLLVGLMQCCGLFYDMAFYNDLGMESMRSYETLSYRDLCKALCLSPLGVNGGWLPALWMLKYIYIGSMVSVILVLSTRDSNWWKSMLNAGIAGIIFYGIGDHYYYCIVMGFLLFRFDKPIQQLDGRYRKVISVVALGILCVNHLLLPLHSYNADILNATFLLLLFCSSSIMQLIFSCAPLRVLGRISFSVYLLHWPVICSLSCYGHLLSFQGWGLLVTTVSVLLMVSYCWTRWIEEGVASKCVNKIGKILS